MSNKLELLRKQMTNSGFDYYLVPSVDDHKNEYVPECWQYRAWISGFDGSAGDVLVGKDKAYLSTDGRYFLQAEQQLNANDFELVKQSGYASELELFLEKNAQGKTLGIDPTKVDVNRAEKLIALMKSIGGKVIFDRKNLIAKVQQNMNDAIEIPSKPIMIQELHYAGQSVNSKLNNLRTYLKSINQECFVETKLDSIMWALNIRGRDVKNTPLAICYMVVTIEDIYLYIDDSKLNDETRKHLEDARVVIMKYEEFYNDLEKFSAKFCIDSANANYAVKQAITKNKHSQLIEIDSPITLSKALKNSIEINGAKDAHRKDAAAFITWWHWVETNYAELDEMTAEAKLEEFRSKQRGFVEKSFDSITGFAGNGAVIHYRSTLKTNKKFDDVSPLLTDSGGQYQDGTTDVTRVFHFGRPTKEHRRFYTLVLKGHLGLGRAVFPKGTQGCHLDVLAREHLWHFSANYAHGTGHGVGSFLGVHEGPQAITPISQQELMPGMILSNEPGAYFSNDFGIRIENLCYVKNKNVESPTGHGPFYCFEDLTLIPYEYKLIETGMLTYTEKRTINNYYSRIRKEVLPLIEDKAVQDFLLFKTRHIKQNNE